MSAFTHGFNHGFFHGMFDRMFGGFGMFNGCNWNPTPLFFTPNYSFGNFFSYQTPMPIMPPSVFNFSFPNFTAINTNTNWQSFNYSANYTMPNFANSYNFGDTFISSIPANITKTPSKEAKEPKNDIKTKPNKSTEASSPITTTPPKGAPFQTKISTSEYNQYNDIILKYARQYDVDPNLVKAVIKQESRFDPNAGSKAGAKGLMQLMPATARGEGLTVKDDRDDRTNPELNIKAGVKVLSDLLKHYNGDLEKTLAAYNWGMGNLAKEAKGEQVRPKETREFVPKVLGYYEDFQKA